MKATGVATLKRDFWVLLRSAPDWQAAFAAVFGTSTEQFYADFEAYRQSL